MLIALLTATALTGAAAANPLGPNMVKTDSERLVPGLYPAQPVPERFAVPPEPGHSPFDIDWSIGLKGTYTTDDEESTFGTVLTPQFTAIHDGLRADIVIDGSAEISKPWKDGEEINFDAMRLGVAMTAPIDSTTSVNASATLALTQDSRTSVDLDPFVTTAPQVLTGRVGAGIDRSFGRFNLALSSSAERTIYGATDRRDTGITDNSEQNLWALDSTLRVGLAATPIIGVFGEASLGRSYYDHASSLGVRSDGTDFALRGGITGSWSGILTASASIGRGYRYFDDTSLGDVATQLYDASITYTPNETVSFTAALNTSIDPVGADAEGTARISHTASADLSYTVNSWLRLRASADWSQSELTGGNETEVRTGLGAGADYTVNAHTALSADYDFGHRENSTTGVRDTHTVSLGVTLQR